MEEKRQERNSTDVYEAARVALRNEGFLPNPWRIGRKLGSLGIEVPSPYMKHKSTTLFNVGLRESLDVYRRIGRVLWSELRSGKLYAKESA